MENFHVPSTSESRSLVSKFSCWKGEKVDVFSPWIASPPPGYRTKDNSVTACRIQGEWDRFGGTCTHSPKRQEDGKTTDINFKSSTTDSFSLEVTSTGGLAHSIFVNASPTRDDGPATRQKSEVNLRILSSRSLDSGVNLNTNNATLSKNIHCRRTKQLTLDDFLHIKDKKNTIRRQRTANTAGAHVPFQG